MSDENWTPGTKNWRILDVEQKTKRNDKNMATKNYSADLSPFSKEKLIKSADATHNLQNKQNFFEYLKWPEKQKMQIQLNFTETLLRNT